MNNALIDFHMHTTCSDGAWSPSDIFDALRHRGIEFFCITDHDTMDSYPVPEDLQKNCISGLEIDTHYAGQTVHLLAYGIQHNDASTLLGQLERQRNNRVARARMIIARLNLLGINLNFEQVCEASKKSNSIGRPHIARALVGMKECGDIQEAFDRYLAEGAAAYVPLERLSTVDAIDLIHENRGVAIVAHPRRLHNDIELSELCRLGIDGIEVVHPSADAEYQHELFALANEKNVIATGGSDFHGRPEEGPIGIDFPRNHVNLLLERVAGSP